MAVIWPCGRLSAAKSKKNDLSFCRLCMRKDPEHILQSVFIVGSNTSHGVQTSSGSCGQAKLSKTFLREDKAYRFVTKFGGKNFISVSLYDTAPHSTLPPAWMGAPRKLVYGFPARNFMSPGLSSTSRGDGTAQNAVKGGKDSDQFE